MITATGATSGDYTISLHNGNLAVTRASLDITADDKTQVYGGVQPGLTASYVGLVNGDTAAAIGGLSLATAPASSHVGSYVITATGATSGDYTISLHNGNLTVTRASLDITADDKTQVYGGVQPGLTATYTGLVNGDTAAAIGGLSLATAPASSHVGSYVITATGATSGDYTISLHNGNLAVTRASLDITADDKTQVYGGVQPGLTATYTGLVNGDTAAAIGGLSLATAPASSHVGSYVITATGATSGDYTISLHNGNLTVTRASLDITADDKTQVYGGVQPGLTATYTGLVNGDTAAAIGGLSLATVPASSHVGSYVITATGATSGDYTISLHNGNLTVTRASLDITADDKTQVYGGVQPGLTATYTGLVNGDTAAAIGGLSLATVPASSHVGSYVITATGATSGDYTISLHNGTLSVTKAALYDHRRRQDAGLRRHPAGAHRELRRPGQRRHRGGDRGPEPGDRAGLQPRRQLRDHRHRRHLGRLHDQPAQR